MDEMTLTEIGAEVMVRRARLAEDRLAVVLPALRRYGRHEIECSVWRQDLNLPSNVAEPAMPFCDCGFDRALKAAEREFVFAIEGASPPVTSGI